MNEQANVTRYLLSDPVRVDLARRFAYHAPILDQAKRYAEIRDKIAELAVFISERAPNSCELATALTHLDAAMMFANAAIARNEPRPEGGK
jgi:hypothetical protein